MTVYGTSSFPASEKADLRPMSPVSGSPYHSIQTTPSDDRYDVVIVGAGVSGLSLAALLAKTGRSVLVLESIHYPGGCASSYRKEGAWFDVGATTFCGTDPGQPLSLLFSEIGTFPGLLRSHPTLAVSVNARRLDLTTDRSEWIARTSEYFHADQERFWREIFSISDAIYGAVGSTPFLPPLTPSEFIRDLPAASIDLVTKLPVLFSTVAKRLQHHNIDSGLFRRFVDAQLLITNQTVSDDAFMLNGALGLSYANGSVSSVRGGMISFARFLEARARSFGAEVAYLQRVTSISRDHGEWNVRTARNNVIRGKTVVTQVPLYNLPSMTDDVVRDHFTSVIRRVELAGVSQWGAVTLYALIPDDLPRGFPLNLQVILDEPLGLTGSDTFFCTFSHEMDEDRCPAGFRTMSVSTHVPPTWLQRDMTTEAYAALKVACRDEILGALRRSVPELSELTPVFTDVGTPKTFRKYTGRYEGHVGGIPLSRNLFPWKYPRPVTPFRGFYTMGDTFFPGQGIPGVVLGAIGIHRRITYEDRIV